MGPLTGGALSLEARRFLSEHSLFPWETQGSGFCQAGASSLPDPFSPSSEPHTLVSVLGHGAALVLWGHLHPSTQGGPP